MTDHPVVLRTLTPDEWAAAVDLSARAFVDEPYVVELFGKDRIPRYARLLKHYRDRPPLSRDAIVVGVTCGPALLGFVSMFPPGRCQQCLETDDTPGSAPSDSMARMEWQFDVDRKHAHQEQGEHAWIHKVAVEPFLHGEGLGRTLVARGIEEARRLGASCVILECQPHREAFYRCCGMDRAATFPDPVGPDVSLMRIDL